VKGSAYTPWFHGDFLRSTAGWTLTERAVYWMLLCAQWESGPLPNDMTRLAAIAGTDLRTINTVWPVVGKKFATSKAGMTNKRMADHHKNYVDFKRRQSEGGKKGMAQRYGKAANVIEFKPSKERPLG
jgi:uncharacterized protein YdaU (DUF1376 family)